MKKRQPVYIPIFIKDLTDGLPYFIMSSSIKMAKNGMTLYIDPYGLAIKDETEIFLTQIVKDGTEYSVDNEMAIPSEVVSRCPKGYITILIQPLPIEEHPEYSNDEIEEELPKEFRKTWKNYSPLGALEEMIAIIDSLMRKDITKIFQNPTLCDMKKFVISKIKKTDNPLLISPVLFALDDEIEGEKFNEEGKTFLGDIRSVADTVHTKLFIGTSDNNLSSLHEISLSQLKEKIQSYSKENLESYITAITNDDEAANKHDAFEKATFIGNYLKEQHYQ